MDDKGFIILHRKIKQWGWYTQIAVKALFIECLIDANHKDSVWNGMMVKRGSFVTSLERLSVETGLSIQQTRTALKKLISTGELTNKSYSKFRIITVKNYDQYQRPNKKSNKQLTNNQQSTNNQLTTNNNDNNDNKSLSFSPTGKKDKLYGRNFKKTALPDIALWRESGEPKKPPDLIENPKARLTFSEWDHYNEYYHANKTPGECLQKWYDYKNGEWIGKRDTERIRALIKSYEGHNE